MEQTRSVHRNWQHHCITCQRLLARSTTARSLRAGSSLVSVSTPAFRPDEAGTRRRAWVPLTVGTSYTHFPTTTNRVTPTLASSARVGNNAAIYPVVILRRIDRIAKAIRFMQSKDPYQRHTSGAADSMPQPTDGQSLTLQVGRILLAIFFLFLLLSRSVGIQHCE